MSLSGSQRLARMKKEKRFRAPLKVFGKYVRVLRRGDSWRLELAIRNQFFEIGREHDLKYEAEWMKLMFCYALSILVSEELTLSQLAVTAMRAGYSVGATLVKRKKKS